MVAVNRFLLGLFLLFGLFFGDYLVFAEEGSTESQSSSREFNSNKLFPGWKTAGTVKGVIGENSESEEVDTNEEVSTGKTRLFWFFIPKIINIIMYLTAPIIAVFFIYAGFKFIYAGDDEELLSQAKDFFLYAFIGIIFIILSYSFQKIIYYVLASN